MYVLEIINDRESMEFLLMCKCELYSRISILCRKKRCLCDLAVPVW